MAWAVALLVVSSCGDGGGGSAATTASPTTASTDDLSCDPVTLTSGGRDVPAERCAPAGELEASIVGGAVVLGGCTSDQDEPVLEDEVARALAAEGVVALVVDYLAASTDPPGTFCAPTDEAIAGLPEVVGAVADATRSLSEDPSIGGGPVAVVGYSFGGLAAAYAELGAGPEGPLPAADFQSMVLLAAPIYPEVLDGARAGELPTILAFQGDADETVPVDDARQLEEAATAGGTDITLVVVPGMDHGWSGMEPEQIEARAAAVPELTDFVAAQLGAAG